METQILDKLYNMMNSSIYIGAIASFIWGLMSIIISPCHLSSIPLIIGYLQSQKVASYKRAFILSSVFSLGILVSLILVGSITYSLGRLIGDVGLIGNILVIGIFLLFGLYFLDIIKLDWSLFKLKVSKNGSLSSSFIIGLIFGLGLGPCTFAFMAPILGIVISTSNAGILMPLSYFGAFALGHCLVIAIAGTMSEAVNKYLQWNEKSGAINIVKKICGILMLLSGIYMIYKNFL
jgi:cytochrome c-type biogenesis protein